MPSIILLFLTCLIISSIGYYRLVYFISVGYGYSIAGMAILTFILSFTKLDLFALIHLALLTLYGIRLATYLVMRDFNTTYAGELKEIKKHDQRTPLYKKAGIWLGVSLLYVCMFMPAYARVNALQKATLSASPIFPILGLSIMVLGILLEALADYQKSAFKKKAPKDFCSIGLYAFVRCPNYLGEILFWTGNFIASLAFMRSLLFLIPSLIGYICIVLIMMGSTKRLEFKQDDRYGHLEAYNTYRSSVPVLFPFLPIYTLKNIKVYLE